MPVVDDDDDVSMSVYMGVSSVRETNAWNCDWFCSITLAWTWDGLRLRDTEAPRRAATDMASAIVANVR